MGTKGTFRVCNVDTPEQIQMCLNCKRPHCVDCLSRSASNSREKFMHKTDGYKNRVLNATAREVIRLYRTAKNDRDIAEQMGRPLPTVTAVRRKFGLPPVRNISKEDRNKLADEWLGEVVQQI